jgi:hypothetical protein
MAALLTDMIRPEADAKTTLAFSGDDGMHSATALGTNTVLSETV